LIFLLIAIGLAQASSTTAEADPQALVETLRAASVRAGQGAHPSWHDAQCGVVGRSRVYWFYGDSGLLVFGKSGGLLLRVSGRYPRDIETHDVDHDGRPELTFEIRTGGGTGTLTLERHIYFFDGQRFAPALRVVSSSYTDSTWFGVLRRKEESFLIPMLSSDGEIRFRDTDGDGRTDLAQAIERRWWGGLDEGRTKLETGPDWVSRRLRARFGIGLGAVQERVVATWRRSPAAPVFVLALTGDR
jgi:hypothetical protein